LERLQERVAQRRAALDAFRNAYWQEFLRVVEVLEQFGAVRDGRLLPKGRLIASLRHDNELLLAETVTRGLFDDLTIAEAAALCSALLEESRSGEPMIARAFLKKRPRLKHRLDRLADAADTVFQARRPRPPRRARPRRLLGGDQDHRREHLAGPDRRRYVDEAGRRRQRSHADVRGEAPLRGRARRTHLEVPARARGRRVQHAHPSGLPLPAPGDRRHGQGPGGGAARPRLPHLRRRPADGQLGPAAVAADPRPCRRGVGLSVRLVLLFRQGQDRRHHAIPGGSALPVIRSMLSVTKRTPLARRGMVVAEHPRGADVGARILERGGNAVDAAVATAFVMAVVEPFMSTIAGAGTMLVHLAKRGETVALDFNGMAPLRAHASMYKTIGGVSDALFPWPNVEGQANVYGHRSVAVPGSVAGLALAVERYGTM